MSEIKSVSVSDMQVSFWLATTFFKPDVHRISNFDLVYSGNDSAVLNFRNRSWIRLVIMVTTNASEVALEKVNTDLHRFSPVSKVIRKFRHSDRKGLARHAILSACRWILAGNVWQRCQQSSVRGIEPLDLRSTRAHDEIYI